MLNNNKEKVEDILGQLKTVEHNKLHQGLIRRIDWQGRALSIIIFGVIVAGIILSIWSAHLEDRRMRDELSVKVELLKLAIDAGHILSLNGSESDLNLPEYRNIKERLMQGHLAYPRCRFLYLMGMRPDGTVFIFADSEQEDSKDYSPPGQPYIEVSDAYRNVFFTGKMTIEGPISDRWGRWVSTLSPIVNSNTGKVLAVLGMDIEAREWKMIIFYHSIFPITISLCASILIAFLLHMRRRDKRIEGRVNKSRFYLMAICFVTGAGNIWTLSVL